MTVNSATTAALQKLGLTTCPQIFLPTPDPAKIHGLEHAWPALTILTTEQTPCLQAARAAGADVRVLPIAVRQTSALLADASVIATIPQGSAITVFKNLPRSEKLAAAHGWQLLAPRARLVRELEDKITFVDFCAQHGLPALPATVTPLAAHHFERPVVVQTRRGHAGESTYFVHSLSELAELQNRLGEWLVKITPLLNLPTFTLNLVVTTGQIFYSQPLWQITDKKLNPLPGGTAGVDFAPARALQKKTHAAIASLAEKTGAALRTVGYRGLAGLDFLVDDAAGTVHLVECNPRVTANLGYLTQLQHAAGEVPLATLALLAHLDLPVEQLQLPSQSAVKEGRQEVRYRGRLAE